MSSSDRVDSPPFRGPMEGLDALFGACKSGDFCAALAMLEDVKDTDGFWVTATDEKEWTPLHWSAWAGHRAIAELLVEKGCDVDAFGEDGETPLFVACSRGHADLIELLLRCGAKANVCSALQTYPLHAAVASQCFEGVVHLIRHGAHPHAKNGAHLTPLEICTHPGISALLASMPASPVLSGALASSLLTFISLADPPVSQKSISSIAALLMSFEASLD
eukprot:gene15923-24354_t